MMNQNDTVMCFRCKLIHRIIDRKDEPLSSKSKVMVSTCPQCKSQDYQTAVFPDDYRIVNVKTGNILPIGD